MFETHEWLISISQFKSVRWKLVNWNNSEEVFATVTHKLKVKRMEFKKICKNDFLMNTFVVLQDGDRVFQDIPGFFICQFWQELFLMMTFSYCFY